MTGLPSCAACGETVWRVSDEGNCRDCAGDGERFISTADPVGSTDGRLKEERRRKVNHVW